MPGYGLLHFQLNVALVSLTRARLALLPAVARLALPL
jgi:hypothetical protein